jgi:hypothetical protein
MTVRPIFAWYDLWVGVFIDRPRRRVYVFPLPCVGLVITRTTPTPRSTPMFTRTRLLLAAALLLLCAAVAPTAVDAAPGSIYEAFGAEVADFNGVAEAATEADSADAAADLIGLLYCTAGADTIGGTRLVFYAYTPATSPVVAACGGVNWYYGGICWRMVLYAGLHPIEIVPCPWLG